MTEAIPQTSTARTAALFVMLAGAVASVGFVFRAGGRGGPKLVTVVISVWVLAPFAVLFLAEILSKRWTLAARTALYRLMLFVTLASLAIYIQDAIWPRKAQAAFVFVAVPSATWLLFALIVPAAIIFFRRQVKRGE